MKRMVMAGLILLAGCADDGRGAKTANDVMGDKACAGVSDLAQWQLCKFRFIQMTKETNRIIEETAREFREAQRKNPPVAQLAPETRAAPAPSPAPEPQSGGLSDENAEMLMLMGAALLSGYNQAQPKITCMSLSGITTCR